MSQHFQPAPAVNGIVVDAHLHLLDRQVLDSDEAPVMVVGDLELTDVELSRPIPKGTDPPLVTALFNGSTLATRVFGGRTPPQRRHRIDWKHVEKLGIVLQLDIPAGGLEVNWPEEWVRDRIIGRIPGAHHDPQ